MFFMDSNKQMSEWIIRSILEENDVRQRANILRFFVRVCGVSFIYVKF
jgi:hypothetical protein